jgi:ribonuclease P protein component
VTSFGLPPEFRLRASADFERVYSQRQRAADGRLLVYGASNGLGVTRAGCSISRKQGNSVVRHRLKRLLREAYRLSRPVLPRGFDLILIPQQGVQCTVAEYQVSLERLAAKIARRLTGQNQSQEKNASAENDG